MHQITSHQALESLIPAMIINGEIESIPKVLDQVIETSKPEVLMAVNQVLASPANLIFLIRQVMGNARLLEKMLENSYYHGNGFHKIVLLGGQNFKLRLHHFGAASKMPMENIHDHRWPFASSILFGELNMDIFKLSDNANQGEELHHFIYNSDKTSGAYSTESTGMACLEKVESRWYWAGKSYLMMTEELHRIRNVEGQESITLILTGKSVNKTCNLYSRHPILEKDKRTVRYDPHQLDRMLRCIMEKTFPQQN